MECTPQTEGCWIMWARSCRLRGLRNCPEIARPSGGCSVWGLRVLFIFSSTQLLGSVLAMCHCMDVTVLDKGELRLRVSVSDSLPHGVNPSVWSITSGCRWLWITAALFCLIHSWMNRGLFSMKFKTMHRNILVLKCHCTYVCAQACVHYTHMQTPF